MSEKQEFRKIYQTRRSGMSRQDVDALSAQICAQITGSALFGGAQYLYAYCPVDGEADIRLAVQTAWQEGKHVAFPQVCGDKMRFLEVKDFGQFAEGAFGIPEPVEAAGAVPVDWLEEGAEPSGRAIGSRLLVLAPGVAFDRQGTRMGRGKGYYDRSFADQAVRQVAAAEEAGPQGTGASGACGTAGAAPRGVTLLGIAYASQVADQIPAEAHDLIVPYLVTENGILCTGEP